MAEFNIRDLAEAHGVKVYDTALPLAWYEDVHKETGLWPQTLGFVWCYDTATTWGEPFPLTREALDCLYAYHKRELERNGSGNLLGNMNMTHVAFMADPPAYSSYVCQTCATINLMEARLEPKAPVNI
jgi:hypothetical protein